METSKITGHTLINMGYEPSDWFKTALEYLNANTLSNEQMVEYLEQYRKTSTIELHDKPVPFSKNIKAENDLEKANVESVVSAMNTIMRTPTVIDGAIMPDACPTGPKSVPVGGIVVTKNAIHPGYHSADICCSLMLTDYGSVSPKEILDAGHKSTHFGPGGRSREDQYRFPSDLLEEFKRNVFTNDENIISSARSHLGTQGDGNHFMYVGISKKSGNTVMVTHHGSRAPGAKLFKKGMKVAERYRRNISPETSKENAWIPFDTEDGIAYWDALQILRKWTKLNHMVIHDSVADILDIEIKDRFWNEHNFVFKKEDVFLSC